MNMKNAPYDLTSHGGLVGMEQRCRNNKRNKDEKDNSPYDLVSHGGLVRMEQRCRNREENNYGLLHRLFD